jgi:Tol biopolymer transport system component
VASAILEKEPVPISALKPMTPPTLDHAIRICLVKDQEERWQTARDVKLELQWIAEGGSQAGASAPLVSHRKLRERLAWSVATLLAVGLVAVAFLYFREKQPTPAAPVRFQIPVPAEVGPILSLSPDGRKLAFLAGGHLWVHFLESGESRELTEAERSPCWSPDSRFIGYVHQGKLKKIEATGGSPQTVADLPGPWGGGAWNQDGVIVFGAPGGLFRVPASGGVPVQITALDPARQEIFHADPSFLPDGRHFVYNRDSADGEKSGIYLGSLDAKPEQQNSKFLVASNWGPGYAPSADPSTGYLLFMREGTLLAQPLDNRDLELKGQATPVAEQVDDNNRGGGGHGSFSASNNDVLVFARGTSPERQLTWFDRQGKVLGTLGEPGNYGGLALSPDGTRVALSKRSGKTSNIWLVDLSQGTSTRFTFGSGIDSNPVWSSDGSRIIFSSGSGLYQKLASGVKDAELLLSSTEAPGAQSWSRDGRLLLYGVLDPKTKKDIWVLPLEGERKPVPFLVTDFNESGAQFSPDGHWVAYYSNESGHNEVYVRSFATNSAGTAFEAAGKWQISNGYGRQPQWRGDGRELYYIGGDGPVMAVEITTNPKFTVGKPQPLGFSVGNVGSVVWVCAADGRRFLVAAPKTAAKASGPEPYTVILNWQAGLKK